MATWSLTHLEGRTLQDAAFYALLNDITTEVGRAQAAGPDGATILASKLGLLRCRLLIETNQATELDIARATYIEDVEEFTNHPVIYGILQRESIATLGDLEARTRLAVLVLCQNRQDIVQIIEQVLIDRGLEFLAERIPIEELDFSTRVYNLLKREGAHYVDQLTEMTEADLLDLRNLGTKGVDEVKLKLGGIGRNIKPSLR